MAEDPRIMEVIDSLGAEGSSDVLSFLSTHHLHLPSTPLSTSSNTPSTLPTTSFLRWRTRRLQSSPPHPAAQTAGSAPGSRSAPTVLRAVREIAEDGVLGSRGGRDVEKSSCSGKTNPFARAVNAASMACTSAIDDAASSAGKRRHSGLVRAVIKLGLRKRHADRFRQFALLTLFQLALRAELRFPNAQDLELLLEDNARALLSGDPLLADDVCALRSGDLATERVEAGQSALLQITENTHLEPCLLAPRLDGSRRRWGRRTWPSDSSSGWTVARWGAD
ncbi:hypothetical protein B0H14DRAFT_3512960 [Mycena olivaceomarginata]|nr:hypothetical protein B0H14DRAFT_3512960 [Mycena olivaceomarginata]